MAARTTKQVEDMIPKWAAGEVTLKELKEYSDGELFAVARIAYYFMMQGKTDEARVLFEGLVAIDPRNDYYYRALGTIFQKIGDNERAIRQFGYAIHINAASALSYVNRAEVYILLERYEEAAADLRKALENTNSKDQSLARKIWALYRVVNARNK